jgi:hypothetical protein
VEDTTTPILGLTKPGFDGPADIREINADLDIIDTAFASIVPQLLLPQRGPTGGLLLGGDTNLYSPAPDVLMTDDQFRIAGVLGLTFGATGDTNLYRSAANTLRTDDSFVIGGSLTVEGLVNPVQSGQLVLPLRGPTGGIVLAGDTNLYSPSANVLMTDDAFQAAGDLIAREGAATRVLVGAVGANAGLVFGLSADTNLYRSAADTLKTDDALVVTDIGLPSAAPRTEWPATSDVIDFAQGDAAIRHGAGLVQIAQNQYYDGASWHNTANVPVSHYHQGGGAHQWYGAASPGGAGTSFTPTLRMQLDASGVLTLPLGGALGIGAQAPTANDAIRVARTTNTPYQLSILNDSGGASANAGYVAVSMAGTVALAAMSAAYVSPFTGKGLLQANQAAGLMLQNNNNGPIQFYVGATGTTLAAQFINDGSLQFGATPATTGLIRLPNASGVYFRNGANTANVTGLTLDSSNQMQIGGATSTLSVTLAASGSLTFDLGTHALFFSAVNAAFYPFDNTDSCGRSANRWTVVYAVNGTIQTSSRAFKQDIADLAPERALRIARATRVKTFTYKGADHVQVGFLAEETDPLLTLDGRSASPQTTACLALAALQELGRRVEELEARVP